MDYLVNLTVVPGPGDLDARMTAAGVGIRRMLAPELELVAEWVRDTFGRGWASEVAVASTRQPPACFLATRSGRLVGFACYDAVARGFFGPTGVGEAARGLGIGQALLLTTLRDMRVAGYGYAAIGDVGPAEFYVRTVGATPIPGSEPGVYAGMLRYPR